MAKEDNLIPFTSDQDREKASINGKKGGVASGKVRREKASFRKSLEDVLNSNIRITKGAIYDRFKQMGIDISEKSLTEIANLGVLFGAMEGNATNYKTLMECNNEIEGTETSTPKLTIEVVDNSKLEKALYEADKHN